MVILNTEQPLDLRSKLASLSKATYVDRSQLTIVKYYHCATLDRSQVMSKYSSLCTSIPVEYIVDRYQRIVLLSIIDVGRGCTKNVYMIGIECTATMGRTIVPH